MANGFIELPIWNPPLNLSYRLAPGKVPSVNDHNPHGQGSTMLRVASIAYVLPIWEAEGEIWSHSRVVFLSGGWLDVNASFEQIEELIEAA